MKATIYTLTDPTTGLVYYVGQTCKKLNQRLFGHRACKRYNTNVRLRQMGLYPIIEAIETVDKNAEEAECYWIYQFKEWGFPLENKRIVKTGDVFTHNWLIEFDRRGKTFTRFTSKNCFGTPMVKRKAML